MLRSYSGLGEDNVLYARNCAQVRANLADCVIRGMQFLDENEPQWWRSIDVETLDLSDPGQCILGQVFMKEAFNEGWDDGFTFGSYSFRLEDNEWDPQEYGFDLPYLEGLSLDDQALEVVPTSQYMWEMLAELWIQIIQERQRYAAVDSWMDAQQAEVK